MSTTNPFNAQYVGLDDVKEVLQRLPTGKELDEMAEHGVFLSEWMHLYYDVNLTFRKGRNEDGE